MAKQTMGFPLHTFRYRSDNKLYKLNTPQSPLVRCKLYDNYSMNSYPLGTNAIIAVISYTGYDMEDAMIVNKSSFERGYGHGVILVTKLVDLDAKYGKMHSFKGKPKGNKWHRPSDATIVESDGLPTVGSKVRHGDVLYSVQDQSTGAFIQERYKSSGEEACKKKISIWGTMPMGHQDHQ